MPLVAEGDRVTWVEGCTAAVYEMNIATVLFSNSNSSYLFACTGNTQDGTPAPGTIYWSRFSPINRTKEAREYEKNRLWKYLVDVFPSDACIARRLLSLPAGVEDISLETRQRGQVILYFNGTTALACNPNPKNIGWLGAYLFASY